MTPIERMATIATYDPAATCPKCGCEDVETHYQDNAHCHSKSCAVNKMGWPVVGDVCCTPAAEHFHRICTRCRYLWAERCLSAEDRAERDRLRRELRDAIKAALPTVPDDALHD